ncbi:sigma-70 family RNA polymerase sigma factor [Burkholderia gladioli pv. gladioli]|uniref:RNA polymerase sigma factor fecI domain protein n=1 Tax=Burkholderia gladioli TaxID=28095 RepID=A0A095HBT4_BURGA|nr:sigma-70 family RNA polymerase sigma factor [Burkholderia gladioli]AJW98347.1 putative RNA polymerase sigma factor fecI domain protein [Burkholderia gladioli]ASD79986.1 RNA polymerase subunit sigma [Burkholderia gladioli pv. gladioli]AWY54767.1 RNA polymerase subunit sigma [Burkholderia gladioli pv. gladioli]KGC11039.1 putative RNA polymerase sigma factor fecI domain protein [Burkholderia gladioli]MDJ1164247.1 sigma-70 family RNA polymerase sigma factor [Burkholderia gladioli pv. gladioli]
MNDGSLTVQSPTKQLLRDGLALSRSTWLSNEFRHSYAWLKSKLHRRVGSHADAEDLAASSFVELAGVDDLAAVREPRAFLTVIAQRLTFELWRRRDLERAYLDSLSLQEEPVVPSAENIAEVTQALFLIDQALNGLSSKAKSAFIYSQVDGLTYADIADRLGVSSSMVRKYITQALEKCYQAG